ncbi:Acetyl esterase/lipase [Sporobacter termitidis DSM 10068]|uniref:Acetyl esterase/lipase n=1 Tax=Sporobacter termitidis DSM 10068 TaxID=1123282 RepID=A0A1M5Y3N3_9FIRM|nr:alpha/beta hydrolase [Sporobacter termitidis]SHI06418.1 Acetyl esterase/lipase [Sporobacter termitidis DSM 10068]
METWSVNFPPEGSMEIPIIDVSGIRRKYLDVAYAAQSPSQKLDIYLPPEGEGPFPTIIFIHGGAFIFGNKRDIQFLQAIDGVNRGYAVVSVEHRLAFEAKYPAPLFDVKAAIRFLRANASKYLLDPERFGACGDSAGGYYAVMAAATAGNPAFEDFTMGYADYPATVKALVSWFGVFDIIAQDKEVEKYGVTDPNMPDVDKLWLGAHSSEIEGLMHFTNPLHFITKDFPPIYILHGSNDHTVPCIQAYLLEEKVREVCGAGHVAMEIMEGYEHGGLELRWTELQNIDKGFAFFDKHLK